MTPRDTTAPTKRRPPARRTSARRAGRRIEIPHDVEDVELRVPSGTVRLTHLGKPFWPELGITKRDLVQYYLDVAPALLPHLRGRAMVMKRYPNGASGKCFFMKRTPEPRPSWLRTCAITHASGNVIDFPIIGDVASLLWVVNLGCIDLNPWYSRCDAIGQPDLLYFDLDPVPGATFDTVRKSALVVRDALEALGMTPFAKTTGSRGVHIAVAIARGPEQKAVWGFAKRFALAIAAREPRLLTAIYRVADRPRGHVLVDYNQNAWGRTLASVYSVRPVPLATVSAPVTWEELAGGIEPGDFPMQDMPARIAAVGDLWAPLLATRGRFVLEVAR